MAVTGPTLAGFIEFVRISMGISTSVLPDNSMWLRFALANAIALCNPALCVVALPLTDAAGVVLSDGRTIYTEAVYNLGADNLINYAQDDPSAPVVPGSEPPLRYFAYARAQWNINGFVSGVIQTASDESTSESMIVQEAAKNFTLGNIQSLKTSWGRTYLAMAQSFGPSLWGIS